MVVTIELGLSIGNSRYHWAWFLNTKFQSSWDTEYLNIDRYLDFLPIDCQRIIDLDSLEFERIPIYLVSVVPSQTAIWQHLPQVKLITLADIPLLDLYPTLGIDRALTTFGAGEIYGYPVLVIDGGTALTITGVNDRHRLVGGAILPGLRLQIRSLSLGTAALPEIALPQQLPSRWQHDTPGAISSGIVHTVSAGVGDFIRDWQQLFPASRIVLTGGDGKLLTGYLRSNSLDLAAMISYERDLLFVGLSAILQDI
jgi:type III pantothenate kinase